jgi:hypothetical protein
MHNDDIEDLHTQSVNKIIRILQHSIDAIQNVTDDEICCALQHLLKLHSPA